MENSLHSQIFNKGYTKSIHIFKSNYGYYPLIPEMHFHNLQIIQQSVYDIVNRAINKGK